MLLSGAVLAFGTKAHAATLEVRRDAPAEWSAAARLSGLPLAPCTELPCAVLTGAALELRWSDTLTEQLSLQDHTPDATLAVVASRLALGSVPVPPKPSPSPASRAKPRPSPTPPPVAPTPPEPPRAEVVSPPPPVPPPPERVVVQAAPPPPVDVPAPVQASRRRTAWSTFGVGYSDSTVLRAQLGQQREPLWWGLASHFDSAVTAEVGGGLVRRSTHSGFRTGAWAGVEVRPQDCFVCSVEVTQSGDGSVSTHTTSPFVGPPIEPGTGPVARLDLTGLWYRTGPLAVAATARVSTSARGTRPEGEISVFWSPD